MASDHLQVPDIQAAQSNKEVTHNDAINKLDRSSNQRSTKAITVSTSLTTTEARENGIVELTGTPGAPFNLNMPDTNQRMMVVYNNTDGQCTIRNSAGGGTGKPSLTAGEATLFHYDGTNFLDINALATLVSAFTDLSDVPGSYSGNAEKGLRVNTGETALEFVDLATVGGGGAEGGGINVRNFPQYAGALVELSGNEAIGTGSMTTVLWDQTINQATWKGRKFWLGANFTFIDGDVTVGTDVINEAGHGMVTGDGPFQLSSSGTLPAGLATATDYWCIRVDDNNFKVALSIADALGGIAVDITAAAGGGTHTLERASRLVVPIGVTAIQLTTMAHFDDDDIQSQIVKNGAVFKGLAAQGRVATITNYILHSAKTATLEVTAGDYFEFQAQGGTTANLLSGNDSWFGITVLATGDTDELPTAFLAIPPAHKGALIQLNADKAGNTSFTDLDWDIATYDTAFDPEDGGDPQRFWLGVDLTFTADNTTDELTATAHGMATGEGPFLLSNSGGALPTGTNNSTPYWCINVSANVLQLATSRANALAGTVVDFTTDGTGTHTLERADRIVIPKNVSKVQLSLSIDNAGDLAGRQDALFTKNGSNTFVGTILVKGDTSAASEQVSSSTAVLEVAEGDVFKVQEQGADAYTLEGNTGKSWVNINVVDTDLSPSFPGVTVERPVIGSLVNKSADETGVNLSGAGAVVSWNNELYDTGYRGVQFHDTSTNNSRMTVPAGVTRVRLTATVTLINITAGQWVITRLFKNGAVFDGVAASRQDVAGTTHNNNVMSPILDVVEGDFFEVQVLVESDTSVDILSAQSSFAMEVVETEDAASPPEQVETTLLAHGAALTASDAVYKKVAARRFSLKDDFAGSVGHCDTVPTGTAQVFDVERNGTVIGTVTFAVSSAVATFATTGGTQEDFEVGDRLEVVTQGSVNSVIRDISITLWAFRT